MKNIKRIVNLSVALTMALSSAAVELPPMSGDNGDNWLYIQFVTNGTVIEDTGQNAELRNREVKEDNDGQLWKLTGTADACTVTSRTGRHMRYDQSKNRFVASVSDPTVMKLVENNNNQWELQIKDESLAPADGSVAIVINGGSGTDKYLDLWKHNFGACGLAFVDPSQMDFAYQGAPSKPAEARITGTAAAPAEELSLWYRKPADNWVKNALPIGSGDMGAMIFGGITQDQIQFNHKTLWKGSSRTGDLGSYLSFGNVYITELEPDATVSEYIRTLDLNRAVATVDYKVGDKSCSREYLASHPDNVIVAKYNAENEGGINVEIQFINAQGRRADYTEKGAQFSGSLGNGMLYHAGLRVETEGGIVSASKSGITVRNASTMTVYLSCATDYDAASSTHLSGVNPAAGVNSVLDAAVAKGFDAIRQDHVADHSSLFGRVAFNIGGSKNAVPTNTLLTSTNAAYRSMVDRLIFAYGRYLTIASSRGVDLPSNLQGIWNKDGNASSNAVWASDIHTNINVQMNYWPAEPTNLSECHLPLLNFIKNEALRSGGTWRKNASDLGVNEGWVVNTASNIFGGSSNYKVGKYAVANAWLCEHLWQHYAYTLDKEYLTSQAWPVMREAVRFWLKRLVKAKDGTLECPNEYSPEQGKVQNATAHSQQLVGMLFRNSLKAIEVVGDPSDNDLRDAITEALATLDTGLRIDSKGLLREWKYQENTPNLKADTNYGADDEQNVWQGHRHTSHLMELYPGFEINPGNDIDIFDAAVASLADRGDKATGWARAWRIALWSRAGNPERAYTTLRGFAHHTDALTYDWNGGLYDNMLDAHATSVFQIEGNFGATAGIAEMLLQSRPDSLVLLPALPAAWSEGSVSGLKAMGNFEVALDWADGKLKTVSVKSLAGQPLTLAYPHIATADVTAGTEAAVVEKKTDNLVVLTTEKGGEYVFTMPDLSGVVTPENINGTPQISVENGSVKVSNYSGQVVICDLAGRNFCHDMKLNPGVYVVKAGDCVQKIAVSAE